MSELIRFLRNDGKVIHIHKANIVNMVTKKGITYIQLGNMDNIMGVVL